MRPSLTRIPEPRSGTIARKGNKKRNIEKKVVPFVPDLLMAIIRVRENSFFGSDLAALAATCLYRLS
jgi:hypothetical protein